MATHNARSGIARSMAALCVVSAAALVAVYIAAKAQAPAPIWFASLVFAAAAVGVGLHVHRLGGGPERSAPGEIAAITRVSSLTYAWGGSALLLMYEAAGLKWQHGWQYGLGMLVIAAGLALYVSALSRPDAALARPSGIDKAVALAAIQGAAACVALVWLMASGKVLSQRGDWGANIIFVAGGFAIMLISATVVLRHRRRSELAD